MQRPAKPWTPVRFRPQPNDDKEKLYARLGFWNARVAELVDARDLKSLGTWSCAGSIPASGISETKYDIEAAISLLTLRDMGSSPA